LTAATSVTVVRKPGELKPEIPHGAYRALGTFDCLMRSSEVELRAAGADHERNGRSAHAVKMTTRTRRLTTAAALLAGLGALAVMALPSLIDVGEARHDLRSYDSGAISEVRIADTVTIYVDEESRSAFGTGLLAGVALVAMSTACAMTCLVLGAVGGRRRVRIFYGLAAGGLAFLGADELLGLHESIGHNLPFLADLPGVERPDDVVFAAYLVPTLVVGFLFRDVLRESRITVRAFAAGLVLFVLSALLDMAGSPFDNPVELLVAVLLAAGLVALMFEHLTTALRGVRATLLARPPVDRAVREEGAAP
jgi:hypothetical protein